jgi:hypothetical protein
LGEVNFGLTRIVYVRPDPLLKGDQGKKKQEKNEGFPKLGCDFVAPGDKGEAVYFFFHAHNFVQFMQWKALVDTLHSKSAWHDMYFWILLLLCVNVTGPHGTSHDTAEWKLHQFFRDNGMKYVSIVENCTMVCKQQQQIAFIASKSGAIYARTTTMANYMEQLS